MDKANKLYIIYLSKKACRQFVCEMVTAMNEFRPHVWCIDDTGIASKNIQRYKIKFRIDWMLNLPIILFRLVALLRKAKNNKQELCFYFPAYHPINLLLAGILRLWRIRTVVSIHDYRTHIGERSRITEYLQKKTMRLAQLCHFLSKSEMQKALNDGFSSSGLYLLPHPIPEVDKVNTLSPGEPLKFLFYGRIVAYKGLTLLLDALTDLDGIELTIAGAGNIDRKDETAQRSNIHIINRFIQSDELDGLFLSHHYIVLPYLDASQSGVLSLALAYELPAVLTRSGGLPEQITGDAALFIRPETEDIRSAFIMLSADKEMYRKLKTRLHTEKIKRKEEWAQSFTGLTHAMGLNHP